MAWKREVWWYDCDIPASNSNIQWKKKEWEFGITQNLYSFVCLFFSANLIHGRVPEGPRHGAHHSMIITLNVFLATWLQLLKLLCVLVSRCIYFTIPLSFVSRWYLFYITAPVQKFDWYSSPLPGLDLVLCLIGDWSGIYGVSFGFIVDF